MKPAIRKNVLWFNRDTGRHENCYELSSFRVVWPDESFEFQVLQRHEVSYVCIENGSLTLSTRDNLAARRWMETRMREIGFLNA